MAQDAKPLVIVGGGFAGTATLLHMILKAANNPDATAANPVRITMVERAPEQLFGGIAYGQTPKHEYNLNLSAKRVTPFAEGERPAGFPSMEEFIESFTAENPEVSSQFVNTSRQFYGHYLRHLIGLAQKHAGGKVIVDTVYDQVTDFTEGADGVKLQLESGASIDASHVVLATGFKEGVSPAFAFNVVSNPNYLEYPYTQQANAFYDRLLASPTLNTPDSHALVVGTGLSAMDSANRLLDNGYEGKITMMSRRGLMHAIYRQISNDPRERLQGEPRDESELPFTKNTPDFITQMHTCTTFDALFPHIKKEMFQRLREGYTTEEVLSHWEKFVPQVYKAFPEELPEFLLKYETAINVMRVGTTPELADKILEAQRAGRLEIISGRIDDIQPDGKGGMSVTWRPNNRHGQRVGVDRTTHFDTVINGIGNSTKYDLPAHKIGDKFWSNQAAKGSYTVHPTRDGVAVTQDFGLLDGAGKPYNRISIVGTPVSGHMNVSDYSYPEKDGHGARLGAFTLNIQGILGGVLELVDRSGAKMLAAQAQSQPAIKAAATAPGFGRSTVS